MYKCKICGKVTPTGEAYNCFKEEYYCKECVIKEMTSNYNLFKEYLEALGLMEEFYVNHVLEASVFESNDRLLNIAIDDFEQGLQSTLSEEYRQMIADYIENEGENGNLDLMAEMINKN